MHLRGGLTEIRSWGHVLWSTFHLREIREMNTHRVVLIAAACLVATAARAHAPASAAAPPFVMATYYRCDYSKQTRADTLYKQVMAPLLDKQIRAGHLTAYGFSSHRMGGVFRRLESWTAPTLADLITAQDAFEADLAKANPKGSAEFDAICGSHDDYIWNRTLGSAPAPGMAAPAFSYSRYMNCEMSKEGYAEEMISNDMANNRAYTDFTTACNGHTDYVWHSEVTNP